MESAIATVNMLITLISVTLPSVGKVISHRNDDNDHLQIRKWLLQTYCTHHRKRGRKREKSKGKKNELRERKEKHWQHTCQCGPQCLLTDICQLFIAIDDWRLTSDVFAGVHVTNPHQASISLINTLPKTLSIVDHAQSATHNPNVNHCWLDLSNFSGIFLPSCCSSTASSLQSSTLINWSINQLFVLCHIYVVCVVCVRNNVYV